MRKARGMMMHRAAQGRVEPREGGVVWTIPSAEVQKLKKVKINPANKNTGEAIHKISSTKTCINSGEVILGEGLKFELEVYRAGLESDNAVFLLGSCNKMEVNLDCTVVVQGTVKEIRETLAPVMDEMTGTMDGFTVHDFFKSIGDVVVEVRVRKCEGLGRRARMKARQVKRKEEREVEKTENKDSKVENENWNIEQALRDIGENDTAEKKDKKGKNKEKKCKEVTKELSNLKLMKNKEGEGPEGEEKFGANPETKPSGMPRLVAGGGGKPGQGRKSLAKHQVGEA